MSMRAAIPVAAFALACSQGDPVKPPDAAFDVALEPIATGLASPVHLTAPAGDARLFVVEQAGRIRIIRDGQLLPQPYLDIRDRVGSGGERGLLGLAFHPQYGANGRFYVNYTDRGGATRIERYHVSSDADLADPASAHLVLSVAQPFANHNGGLVAFGPDGMLFIGMGDGGSGGDPLNHGQNRSTLLGALLRIDVDRGEPYAIPAGNPFRGRADARPEIWAWGLRNPWRFAFDRVEQRLYIADVGQSAREEINVAPAGQGGLNYGWAIMEGTRCFRPATGCDTTGLTLPVLDYDHGQGCSVTGGHVYRGSRVPGLVGHYVYGDYCRGWIRSFRLAGGQAVDRREWAVPNVGQILSFGEDAAGELYVLTTGSGSGRIHRIRRP
jgi:glucose/arabinose dehydrogenase